MWVQCSDPDIWVGALHPHISTYIYINIYAYIHTCIHIYMYIYRNGCMGRSIAPSKGEVQGSLLDFSRGLWSIFSFLFVSFFICIYIHIYIYIYIYDSSGKVQRSLLDFSRGLYYICVLMLLNMCPHTTKCVLILLYAS